MGLTCKYCGCCTSVVAHISNHYDPAGETKFSENAAEVLAIFQATCESSDGCDLDVEDVQEYIDSRPHVIRRRDIESQVKTTALNAWSNPGWWAVRLHPDGTMTEDYEPSPRYSLGETCESEPRTVTIWSSTSVESLSPEEIEYQDDDGDWTTWFDVNLYQDDFDAKIEPTGLELVD